jgi:hypothetical protein
MKDSNDGQLTYRKISLDSNDFKLNGLLCLP